MKTIVHVILSLEIGGMERVVCDLVQNLDKNRYKPVVVCLEKLGVLAEELTGTGITVIQLEKMMPIVSYLFPYQLIKALKKYKPDVVHTHSGCWHKAAMASFLCGVKNIIYTDHGRHCPDSKKVICLDRVYSAITNHVIGVSQDLAEYMIRVVGVGRRKVSCIINGIDETKVAAARRPQDELAFRLGIVARLAQEKDIGSLLRACRLLKDRGKNVSLAVVGDGYERQMLEELALSLGLDGSVKFLGFRRDIAAILADIDIFVLSSISEGTSITLLEAMAAGKPVVVTKVGGNPAIIEDRINGFLVPPREPSMLADALGALMDDKPLRERMSAANTLKVHEKYSIRAMTAAYERLYGD